MEKKKYDLEERLIEFTCNMIDVVEALAEQYDWEYDRVADDQIAMAVEGRWKTYSLTLAWSRQDETLRTICSFEMEPPEDRISELLDVVNRTNDMVWTGAFTYWTEQKLMVWRYGLIVAKDQQPTADQVDKTITSALAAAERFYPAFQLVAWAGHTPADAMKVAIAEAYGRA